MRDPRAGCVQERRPPAGVALRARLLSIFCKSVAAASCFPHSLTVNAAGAPPFPPKLSTCKVLQRKPA